MHDTDLSTLLSTFVPSEDEPLLLRLINFEKRAEDSTQLHDRFRDTRNRLAFRSGRIRTKIDRRSVISV